MKKTNVLYIGGYGRSGSTLLDRLLSSSPEIAGVGELYKLPRNIPEGPSPCGCGQKTPECSFWQTVFDEMVEMDPENTVLPDEYHLSDTGVPNLDQIRPDLNQERFQDVHSRLFHAIRKASGPETQYVTDTSKTAADGFLRPFRLQNCYGLSVRMIHLIRDGRATLWSKYKKDRKMNQGIFSPDYSGFERFLSHPALRTGLHWPFANLTARLFSFCYPSQYIQVRYEDFTNNSLHELDRISNFLDVSLSLPKKLVRNNEPIPKSHQISGNRLRRKDNLRLHEDRQSWKDHLTDPQLLLYKVLGGFIIHLYGY